VRISSHLRLHLHSTSGLDEVQFINPAYQVSQPGSFGRLGLQPLFGVIRGIALPGILLLLYFSRSQRQIHSVSSITAITLLLSLSLSLFLFILLPTCENHSMISRNRLIHASHLVGYQIVFSILHHDPISSSPTSPSLYLARRKHNLEPIAPPIMGL